MKKAVINEHLVHILNKTTPYQRMLWLKRAIEFWKTIAKQKKLSPRK